MTEWGSTTRRRAMLGLAAGGAVAVPLARAAASTKLANGECSMAIELFDDLSKAAIPDPVKSIVTSGKSRVGEGAALYVEDPSLGDGDVAAASRFVARTTNGRYFRRQDRLFLDALETGARFNYGASDQQDDTDAINDGIAWLASRGGGELLLPAASSYCEGTILQNGRVSIRGAAGHLGGSRIVCGNMTGPAIRIPGGQRGATLESLCIDSTPERLRRGTEGRFGAGIFFGPDDEAGQHFSMSRLQFSNLYIIRQPGDGIYGTASPEMAEFRLVTIADCLGRGIIMDDGTDAGYRHKFVSAFMAKFDRVRAMECGLEGMQLGAPGQANRPLHIFFYSLQSLGCCWNRARLRADGKTTHQVKLYAGDVLLQHPDIEDHQFDQAETTSTQATRIANAEPAQGILFSGSGFRCVGGHFSSLTQSFEAQSGSDRISIDDPNLELGAFGRPQSIAFVMPTDASVRFSSQSFPKAAARLLKAPTRRAEIAIDGIRYRPSRYTALDGGLRDPVEPDSATISKGIVTSSSVNLLIRGEGGLADELVRIEPLPGVPHLRGDRVVTWFGGEAITFSTNGRFVTKSGQNLRLDASRPVIEWMSDGQKLVEL